MKGVCAKGHVLDRDGVYQYGNQRQCKPCRIEMSREYGKRPAVKERRRLQAASNRERSRVRQLTRDYGLTLGEFQARLEAQGGGCAICGRPESARSTVGGVRRIAVDHDHDTGNVRGLLCSRCNRALGYLMDDLALVESARRYLQSWFPR